MVMDRHVASAAAAHHGGHDDGSRPTTTTTTTTTTMRGAAGARKVLGSALIQKPEYYPPVPAGNCNPIVVVDRGSCSRTATCPTCSKDVSSARGEEVAISGKDSRWADGGESAEDRRGLLARRTSAGVAVDDLQTVPLSSEMKVPKEEQTTMDDSEEAAEVNESSLAKLKRKIRLKLLAEEARTTQLLAIKAEEEECSNVGNGRREKRAADDGPSSSAVTPVKGNSCPLHHQQHNNLEPHHHHHQQLLLSQQACEQALRNNGPLVRVEGRIIVDLSSDDEAAADIADPSRFQQQQNKQHRSQSIPQAAGAAAVAAAVVPKEEVEAEEEAYSAVLERMLGPLLAKAARAAAAEAADQTTTRLAQKNRSIAGLPRKKSSSKPSSKKKQNSQLAEPPVLSAVADLLDLCKGQQSSVSGTSAPAAGHQQRVGGAASSNNTGEKIKRKRGRPRKEAAPLREPKSSALKDPGPAENKGEMRIPQTTAIVPNSYEQERENNILRNKVFLQRLNLCTPLETRKLKEQTPKPHDSTVVAPPPTVIENYDIDLGRDQSREVIRNNDLHSDHRVESQRSQITSALSGSSSAMQRLEKTPTSTDDVDYEPEEQLEENDDNSSKSSRPPRTRGKGKSLQKGPFKEKAPRGRPRKIKTSATTSSKEASISNQELIRIVADLLTSRTAGALPPNLLERLINSSNGGDSHQTGTSHRGRPAASISKKKSTGVQQQKGKRKAESAPPHSPTSTTPSTGTTGKKQRKETWLATIPFETPKTDYEIQRDEALRRQKDQLERLGAVAELIEEIKGPPRPTRPYHKRWSLNPDPVFNRQTRLKDRLNTKTETAKAVKQETVEAVDDVADDVDELEERPDPSFSDSSVAMFSNWATLQKHRPAATTTREWDLNEPSMSTGERVVSFEVRDLGRDQLVDPMLTRIFTMDVGAIRGQYSGLLAAGGSQGRIAVFALKGLEAWSSHGRGKVVDEADAPSRLPLMSWSVDSSWISQVIFLPNQFKEKQMLLLSSSNDGRVVLWDVNKKRVQKGTRELSQEGMPRVVCQTTTLHSGSIFGMHEMDGRMATASEDGVGISVVKETMIFMEKCISGHHSGVIRNIRFRDKDVLADCGADMVIGILDLRVPEQCTLKLPTAHKTAMNVVEWSPGSDNVLLSASLDPQIYLHDIRSPRKYLHALDGHVHPRRLKCYGVYRPAFVDGGQAVVSPGEGTHQLSLYAVDTGCPIGKVHLGHDTATLAWSEHVPSTEGGLWAGSNGITHCRPVWRLPSGSGQFDDGQYNDGQERLLSSHYSAGGTSMPAEAPTSPDFGELL